MVYKAVVASPLNSIVVSSPETLAFGSRRETKSYAPTITFEGGREQDAF